MAMNILPAFADDMLDVLVAAFTAGGTLELRTGARPTAVSDPDAGSLLATFTIPAPGFAAASGGSANSLGTPWLAVATGTGVAGHGRFKDSLGNAVLDVVAGGAVPGDTTDDATDTITTAIAHGFVANQPFVIQTGIIAQGVAYAGIVDTTTIQALDAPGGAVLPMPPTPITNFYLKDPAVTILIGNSTGTITLGDTVPLFDFALRL